MELKGKTAIITGGASGLGEATARRFVKAGANVVLADIQEEKGKAVAASLGANAIFVKTDVTKTPEIQALIKAALDKFGAIHILINNAGVGAASRTLGKTEPYKIEWFKQVVDINLIAVFDVLSKTAWEMAKNQPNEKGEKGVIINTASVAAFDGQIGQAGYSASKAGVVGMTLPIARDLSRDGIRICTICPGIMDTPMMAALPAPARESLGQQVPFPPRLGFPDEFAQLAEQIVENTYLNGETIRMDGAIRMAPK
jgi:3-hydroxyacyl-CoA dehydrogenase/3-hydroxy-2-methylbutyryl-CoA dehydrogenase